mgnify:CR=1 FL=1
MKNKKRYHNRKVKQKKLDFKDFAKQDSSELKFLAGFFIVLAFIMNPREGYIGGGFEWDLFLIALFFIVFFYLLGTYYRFRSWIRYLKDEDH